MQGLMAVYRKELSDHFSSYRFVLLFGLIAMVSFITCYMAAMNLRDAIEGGAKSPFVFLLLFNIPGALLSMVQFIAFFGPLIGIILGFDAINRERAQGTLVKVLSQPIYRDSVINGKFLAGATTITIMVLSIVLVISGLGLILLGIVPGVEEIWRLIIYMVISVFYISFWLGLSILFSVLFRGIATSALASVALWIFLSSFVSLIGSVIADNLRPINKENPDPEVVLDNAYIKEVVSIFSPTELYSSASGTIINPMRKTTSASQQYRTLLNMGAMGEWSSSRFQNPLELGQSILVVYPHMVALIALSLICFAISYTVFMVQEIRT